MINVVIPMAGECKRFTDAGFSIPKPFIDICGTSMIERVIRNLALNNARYILIARDEHYSSQKSICLSLKTKYNCSFINIDRLTEGAAVSVLLACWNINNDEPLLIANCDQIVNMKVQDFVDDCHKRNLDGSILTFPANHTKWSYAKINDNGYVTEVREKEVISNHATVGLYYFIKGSYFINSAIQMIAYNDRVNNEFYTAPVYNYVVKQGLKIGIYDILESQMHGTGTPEDFREYINYLNHYSKGKI